MDQYEWDETKNETNRLKHGIGFERIADFDWSAAFIREDVRFDYGEVRLMGYGRIDGRYVAVAFVVRGHSVRIIGMRFVHGKELRRYGLQD